MKNRSTHDDSAQALQDAPTGSHCYERREMPRRPGCGIVQVLRCENSKIQDFDSDNWSLKNSKLKGILLDISKTGIAFILPEKLDVNETLHLRIFNPRTERHSLVSGIVIDNNPMQLNNWRISCQFNSKLTVEILYEMSHALTE